MVPKRPGKICLFMADRTASTARLYPDFSSAALIRPSLLANSLCRRCSSRSPSAISRRSLCRPLSRSSLSFSRLMARLLREDRADRRIFSSCSRLERPSSASFIPERSSSFSSPPRLAASSSLSLSRTRSPRLDFASSRICLAAARSSRKEVNLASARARLSWAFPCKASWSSNSPLRLAARRLASPIFSARDLASDCRLPVCLKQLFS